MPFLGQTKTEDGNEYVWDGEQWATRTISLQTPSPYLQSKNTRRTRLVNAGDTTKFKNGETLYTQEDANQYFAGRLDGLDSGVPDVDLHLYATVDYSDAEDAKLDARITTLENAPGGGGGGGIEEAPTDGKTYGRKDSDWVSLEQQGGGGLEGPTVILDDSPPSGADDGDLWFNNDESFLTLSVFDANALPDGQWIPAAPPTTLEGRVAAGELAQTQIQTEIDIERQRLNAIQLYFDQGFIAFEDEENTFRENNTFEKDVIVKHNLQANHGIFEPVYSDRDTVLTAKASMSMSGTDKILYISGEGGTPHLMVQADGKVSAGAPSSAFVATENNHILTKKWATENIFQSDDVFLGGNLGIGGTFTIKSGNTTKFSINNSGVITTPLLVKSGNNENFRVDADGTIKMRDGVMPQEARDVANKQYVDDLKEDVAQILNIQAGNTVVGVWQWKKQTPGTPDTIPRSGNFHTHSGMGYVDDWMDVRRLEFSQTDAKGRFFSLSKITGNNLIKFDDGQGNDCLFIVIQNDSLGIIQVMSAGSAGSLIDGREYTVTVSTDQTEFPLDEIQQYPTMSDVFNASHGFEYKMMGYTADTPSFNHNECQFYPSAGNSMERFYFSAYDKNDNQVTTTNGYTRELGKQVASIYRLNNKGQPELIYQFLFDQIHTGLRAYLRITDKLSAVSSPPPAGTIVFVKIPGIT